VTRALSPEGEPVAIAQDAMYDSGVWRGAFSVARNGVLTFHSGRASLRSSVVWMDRKGTILNTVGDKDLFWDVEISPNQQRAILPMGDPLREVWVQDLQRNTRTRLTLAGWADQAVWSADGSAVYADIIRNGEWQLVSKKVTGTETVLRRQKQTIVPRAASPDGKWIFAETDGIVRIPADREGTPDLIVNVTSARNPVVSPNGKWLAYQSDENGHTDIFVISLEHRESKWQVSPNGGDTPRWRGDGKELFYLDASRRMTVVPVTENGNVLDFGPPQTLFATTLRPQSRPYDVTKDGSKFLVDVLVDQDSPTVVVLNDWKLRLH
jgi:hypothetical protein